jgi:hypothetical protein
MWAIGPDFNFNEAMIEIFSDFDSARDAAFDWSVELHGRKVIIWKMGTIQPLKWMEITA